jgi:hypothetical protein
LRCIDKDPGVGLRGGLALSLLFHACFLYFVPEVTPRPLRGKPSALSVTLIRQQTESSRPAARLPTELAISEALRMTAEIAPSVPTKSAPLNAATPETIVDAAPTKDEGMAGKAMRRPVQLPRGTAGVVLVINPVGAVGEIVWGNLPVLTLEQLESIERRLRQRRYPALGRTYPANEIIDPQSGEVINSPPAATVVSGAE